MIKVVKFGGTSLASAEQMQKCAAIVRAQAARRYVIVSAPGKRFSGDEKVTDLLLKCRDRAAGREDFSDLFAIICDRFTGLIRDLGISLSLEEDFQKLRDTLSAGKATADEIASRGEYFNGKIFAALLGFPFLDAAEFVFFDERGVLLEEETNAAIAAALLKFPRAVIPGFYGSEKTGRIRTFSRGGSDVTGSLVARAVKADLYENWTDVSGLLMADPRVVPDPKPIAEVTYRELRELSYMGASVLHEDAIFPVRKCGIPIHIKNTNAPEDPGTLIVENAETVPGSITGIAGKKGFVAVHIEKDMMNSVVGFGRRVLSVLEKHAICFEHLPSGIDTLSVLISSEHLAGKDGEVLREIGEAVSPDRIELLPDLALIAVVGRGMIRSRGMAARLFSALAKNNINIRMIDQGSSELNIIVGVENRDYENAIRAIYGEFVG